MAVVCGVVWYNKMTESSATAISVTWRWLKSRRWWSFMILVTSKKKFKISTCHCQVYGKYDWCSTQNNSQKIARRKIILKNK
jgi:hypothetical protein